MRNVFFRVLTRDRLAVHFAEPRCGSALFLHIRVNFTAKNIECLLPLRDIVSRKFFKVIDAGFDGVCLETLAFRVSIKVGSAMQFFLRAGGNNAVEIGKAGIFRGALYKFRIRLYADRGERRAEIGPARSRRPRAPGRNIRALFYNGRWQAASLASLSARDASMESSLSVRAAISRTETAPAAAVRFYLLHARTELFFGGSSRLRSWSLSCR